MKAAINTLSAAILIVAAPVVLAGNASTKAPHQRQQVSKKHPMSIPGAARRVMYHDRMTTSYPRSFGRAPGAPQDYTSENSRNAGGGGGGGSGM